MIHQWRTGRSCVFKNTVHLVFVTKYRRNVITYEMLQRMQSIMKETALQMQCEVLEFNGEDDHVHMILSIHPKHAISNVVSKLKGKSSYIIRKEFWTHVKTKLWGKRFWSPSYCVVSVGGATLDVVKKYIENQRQPASDKQINQSKKISKLQDA